MSNSIATRLTIWSLIAVMLIGGIGFVAISRFQSDKTYEALKQRARVTSDVIRSEVVQMLHSRDLNRSHLQEIVAQTGKLNGVKSIEIFNADLMIIAHVDPSRIGDRFSVHLPLIVRAQQDGAVVERMNAEGLVRIIPIYRSSDRQSATGSGLQNNKDDDAHSSAAHLALVEMIFDKSAARNRDFVESVSTTIQTSVNMIMTNLHEDSRAIQIMAEDLARLNQADHIEIVDSDYVYLAHSDPTKVGQKSLDENDNAVFTRIFAWGKLIEEIEKDTGRYERYFPIFEPGGPEVSPIAICEVAFSPGIVLQPIKDFQRKFLGLSAGLLVVLFGVFTYIFRRITSDRQNAESKLNYLLHHDELTGLSTQELLIERLNQAVIRSPWTKRVIAVISLNVVQFKRINDSLGHRSGNLLLQSISKRLSSCIRSGDAISRMGGDHFTVALLDMGQSGDEGRIAQNIIDSLMRPFNIAGHELFIQVCMGIATYPQDGEDSETLLSNAETAMGRVREEGATGFQYYSPEMSKKISERLTLETDLQKAVKNGELYLNYQPIVAIEDGSIQGFEALIRWKHPEKGIIPPNKFIPMAEECGQIYTIGEWVLRTACVQTRVWNEKSLSDLYLSVNLSPRQFQQKNLLGMVKRVIDETGFSPERLTLELTESTLMKDIREAERVLGEFNRMQISVAIDDFGTGYSSLSYLKRFSIQTLKIDRSFIRDIMSDPSDAAIVKAIITMAHSLNLRVVAEGVETREQLEFLQELGCDAVQGYLLSRPISAILAGGLLTGSRRIEL